MKTLKRLWRWFDSRTGAAKAVGPALKHPVPPGVASRKGWFYVFGLATLTAFLLQVVTGMTLATKYVPSAAHAYDSLQYITNEAFLGRIVRGMHFFGASAMVVFVVLHAVRVFLTGSYKFPREVNWITGVVLLVLTLAMAYTGQLLRWDENGVWSVAVLSHFVGRTPVIGGFLADFILAGSVVGGTTLSRFFAFHVFWLPALIFLLIGAHLFLLLHHGVSEPPAAGQPVDPATYQQEYQDLIERRGPPYFPDAMWREVVVAVGLIATVAALAIVVGPRPLGAPPDPSEVRVDPRPDWYFLPYYALLTIIPRAWTDFAMVYAPLLLVALLIVLPLVANKGERSPFRRPWALGFVAGGGLAYGGLLALGVRAPWAPDFDPPPPPVPVAAAPDSPVAAGAVLFQARGCQYCHAVADRGGRYGPDLTRIGLRVPPTELAVIILQGRGVGMPAYHDILTPEETNAIVAYLSALSAPAERERLAEQEGQR